MRSGRRPAAVAPELARAALALLLALAACVPAPAAFTPTPAVPATATAAPRLFPLPPRLRSPEYGMHVFLWWTIDGKTADNDTRLVRDMGFGWLKQKFAWRDIELAKGAFDWRRPDGIVALAQHYGLKLLIRLDFQPQWAQADPSVWIDNGPPARTADFEDYCSAVAGRYAGRIAAYEVWNEPNLSREWAGQPPDPAGYVALLKACYLAIKAADPSAMVVSAGLAPTDCGLECGAMPDMAFYQAMYAAGAAAYFDVLGVHAPGYSNPPERSPAETELDPQWQGRVWTFRHVEDVRALMVQNGDGDKQIAITEMGWTTDQVNPTYSWYAVSEAQQADYLVRAYEYARANWAPWIGLMTTIYITDPYWTEANEQYWWAITRPVPPGDPPQLLPAYEALKLMDKVGEP